ncbi:MAG: hypothetical protein KZQ83_00495 [gamma proteobacterium symbiont of Taylorina sp.]|nr:hypothetical protein [gamma proteobacterium symbiont of Taylorina sp.]
MTHDEINEVVQEIQLSQTFSKLLELSQTVPVDTNDEEELKTALSTCLMEMVRGLDNNCIHFDSDNDKAMFHGLLTICLTIVFDGKVNAEKMSMQ